MVVEEDENADRVLDNRSALRDFFAALDVISGGFFTTPQMD